MKLVLAVGVLKKVSFPAAIRPVFWRYWQVTYMSRTIRSAFLKDLLKAYNIIAHDKRTLVSCGASTIFFSKAKSSSTIREFNVIVRIAQVCTCNLWSDSLNPFVKVSAIKVVSIKCVVVLVFFLYKISTYVLPDICVHIRFPVGLCIACFRSPRHNAQDVSLVVVILTQWT